MHEFLPKKKVQKKQNSVDGFVSRSPSLDGRSSMGHSKNYAQESRSSLDSFSSNNDGELSNNRALESAIEHRGSIPATPTRSQYLAEDKPKKKASSKKIFKGIFMVGSFATVSALLVGGFLFGKAWLGAHKVFQGGGSSTVLFSKDVKPEQLNGEGDGRVNVLLAGIGGGDHPGADLTDSILVASIDPVGKEVTLISVPRDLWVKVPDFWSMKINSAYSSAKELAIENGSAEGSARDAGFATLEKTIEETLGIQIHYHALVNFQAFKQGVDAVGGVEIDVPEDLYDPMIGWEINAPDNLIAAKGVQTFDGMHALTYARSRYTSSDFARGERQRQVLVALKEKGLSSGTFANPKTLTKLIDALGNNVTVNATLGEIMRMYDIVKDIPPTSIVSTSFAEEPNLLVSTDIINDQSVVIPRIGTSDYSEIQSFIRNTVRDPYLKKENATVAVLNGSGVSGAASKQAEELKSYGYNVTIVEAAPTEDYVSTVIYEKVGTTAEFTRNYLEKRLGIKVTLPPTTSTVPITTDFVIVVGKNEATDSNN